MDISSPHTKSGEKPFITAYEPAFSLKDKGIVQPRRTCKQLRSKIYLDVVLSYRGAGGNMNTAAAQKVGNQERKNIESLFEDYRRCKAPDDPEQLRRHEIIRKIDKELQAGQSPEEAIKSLKQTDIAIQNEITGDEYPSEPDKKGLQDAFNNILSLGAVVVGTVWAFFKFLMPKPGLRTR
jgi:hypothetical protein